MAFSQRDDRLPSGALQVASGASRGSPCVDSAEQIVLAVIADNNESKYDNERRNDMT